MRGRALSARRSWAWAPPTALDTLGDPRIVAGELLAPGQLLSEERQQAAGVQDRPHRSGQRRHRVRLAAVSDGAGGEIDGQFVLVPHSVRQLAALEHWQALVDRVAEEDAGERLGDHGLDARAADRAGGLLAGAAAAEVLAGNDELVRPHAGRVVVAEHLEDVLGQLVRID